MPTSLNSTLTDSNIFDWAQAVNDAGGEDRPICHDGKFAGCRGVVTRGNVPVSGRCGRALMEG